MGKIINPLWFNSYQEWIRYVNKFMMNAEKQDGMAQIIMKDKLGETIACWQKDGCGQVYEKRTKERLEKDIQKLK